MTIHYHGTPITPRSKLVSDMLGCCFCVSYSDPRDVKICHQIGQSVMLDNGAFSFWKTGKLTDWDGFYSWADQWLDCATTWAVIPDVIDGEVYQNEDLIRKWPFGDRGAPVWHMHESISRLLELLDAWPRVCIGSSERYSQILSMGWQRRIDEAFNAIVKRHQRIPWIHMLRGMQLARKEWPFASLDSTDIARNHNLPQNTPEEMARRWDQIQCPIGWLPREQLALEGGFYEREEVT